MLSLVIIIANFIVIKKVKLLDFLFVFLTNSRVRIARTFDLKTPKLNVRGINFTPPLFINVCLEKW